MDAQETIKKLRDALKGIAEMHIDTDTDHQQLSALCMAIALTTLAEIDAGAKS